MPHKPTTTCVAAPHAGGAYSVAAALTIERCMMEATSIITIFCLTSTMSSHVRYTVAPILRATEMTYLRARGGGEGREGGEGGEG